MGNFRWKRKGGDSRYIKGERGAFKPGHFYGRLADGRRQAAARVVVAAGPLGVNEGYEHIAQFPTYSSRFAASAPVQTLLDALETHNVRVFVSPERLDRADARLARLGLTAPHTSLPPLIWLNMNRHGYLGSNPDEEELLDTLAHEATHAMSVLLGYSLPDPTAPLIDQALAEVTAHHGSSILLERLGLPAKAASNRAVIDQLRGHLEDTHAISAAITQGEQAAALLFRCKSKGPAARGLRGLFGLLSVSKVNREIKANPSAWG